MTTKRLLGLLAALALLVAACGGDNESALDTAVNSAAEAFEDAGEASSVAASDLPAGFETLADFDLVDGWIPELADLPIPAGDAFFQIGNAYSVDVDPRATAVQPAYFSMAAPDVAQFYVNELLASGYTEGTSNQERLDETIAFVESNDAVFRINLEFVGPDGIPLGLTISTPTFDGLGNTIVNVNRFRAGG